MLKEMKQVSQHPGEAPRRWFSSETFDLIVWYSTDHRITSFQLCYRQGIEQKALTWDICAGFSHKHIDDGESRPFRPKMTPILVPDGSFERDHVLALFEDDCKEIDPAVVSIVTEMIRKYPLETLKE